MLLSSKKKKKKAFRDSRVGKGNTKEAAVDRDPRRWTRSLLYVLRAHQLGNFIAFPPPPPHRPINVTTKCLLFDRLASVRGLSLRVSK